MALLGAMSLVGTILTMVVVALFYVIIYRVPSPHASQ